MGYLQDDDVEEFVERLLKKNEISNSPSDLPMPDQDEEQRKEKAVRLIDNVIDAGEHLSEAGYLARILYHLDVQPNDFMVGVLWSELNWFSKHEPNVLLGARFAKRSSLDPANEARARRAEEDEREIVRIARRFDFAEFQSKSGTLKIRPLARRVKEVLEQGATSRSCGLRKIELCLRKKF